MGVDGAGRWGGLAHCIDDLTECLAIKGVHCATGLGVWHVLNSC